MSLSSGPSGGLAGDLQPYQHICSPRDVESNVDPASYEHFIETLRQGSAGALRVAAAARVLQREAHQTSTFAKAALGAATSILDNPDGTSAVLAKRETQRYAIAWWNRYFKDLTKSEPRRIRARRSMTDAKAQKEEMQAKVAELESINREEFQKRLSDQQSDLTKRETDYAMNTQSNVQMKLQMAEAKGDHAKAAKYRDMLEDYYGKREREQVSIQEAKQDIAKQRRFIAKLPMEIRTTKSRLKSAGQRYENAEKMLGHIRGELLAPGENTQGAANVVLGTGSCGFEPGLQNLKYAAEQEAAATATEAEAAKDLGEAALDQTEANLFEQEAQTLDADVASETAGSELLVAESETAAKDSLAELSEQVQTVADGISDSVKALPVAEGGLDAAADAAVDAVAAAAGGAAAEDAALTVAAGTIAEEGPKVVAAAQEEWALGSSEIQAANDQRVAIEKDVQATALEGDVPLLQAGADSAHEAAAASAMAAVGYLTAASTSQVLAMAVQVPILVVVLTQRASLTTWASGRKASHPCWLDFRMLLLPEPQLQGPNLGRDREGLWFVNGNSPVIQCTEVSANARGWTQYGVILASVLNPWANVVMMAATRLGNEDRPQAICRQQVCVNVN
ncbi:unnamed protein product [Effrenium voratum]|uniref:Uncharacterized protein n=1 Tax=Effrenium voratum TaxID=2562239 RepID=A0AA36NHF3_9DINO|nr:unnamed protein product [Effrenium voratum]